MGGSFFFFWQYCSSLKLWPFFFPTSDSEDVSPSGTSWMTPPPPPARPCSLCPRKIPELSLLVTPPPGSSSLSFSLWGLYSWVIATLYYTSHVQAFIIVLCTCSCVYMFLWICARVCVHVHICTRGKKQGLIASVFLHCSASHPHRQGFSV